MSRQFIATVKKIKGLRTELFRSYSAFGAYEVLQEMRAPNIIGDFEASRNAQAMGDHKGFLNVAEHAMNTEFLVSLAKLYDDHPDGTSLPKLLDYICGNIKYLTLDAFIEYNSDRPDIEMRKIDYKCISLGDIDGMKKKLGSMSQQIAKLKAVRDKHIAHLEMKNLEELQQQTTPKDVDSNKSKIEDLTYGEISNLIEAADEMLNNISSLVNRDIADFRFLKETVTQDTEQLVKLIRKTYDAMPTGM